MIEKRLALVHRIIIPDADYPKENAILITDQRSIFIREPKTRRSFVLRGEMKWGTSLVTDVVPKRLEDYEETSLEALLSEPFNYAISHEAVVSLIVKGDRPMFRRRDFLVKWTMRRQREIYRVYNFEITYRKPSDQTAQIKFYAVPLGAYFKPRRQTQTREKILREYAEDILEMYRAVLPTNTIAAEFDSPNGPVTSAKRENPPPIFTSRTDVSETEFSDNH